MEHNLKFTLLEERIVLDAAAAVHVIFVNGALGHNGDGSLHNPYNNLQSALSAAASSPVANQIDIASGTYLPTTGIDSTNTNRLLSFNIPNNTTLIGGFNSTFTKCNPTLNPTILSGDIGVTGTNSDNSFTVVTVGISAAETVALDRLTITEANNNSSAGGSGSGGGLLVENGSTLTLSNMTFSNNTVTGVGGAIYATGDQSITISGSLFENNTAVGNGAAIRFRSDTNVLVTQSTFDHNSVPASTLAKQGGGAISTVLDQKETFTYNTFTYNSDLTPHGYGGGAIYSNSSLNTLISHNIFGHNNSIDPVNHGNAGGAVNIDTGGTITITYNSFANNTSDAGGAIGAVPFVTDLNISYNSFYKNNATLFGGAVFSLLNASVTINTNLFVSNNADSAGGALALGYADSPGLADTNASVTNNIFISNTSPLGGAIASQEKNLVIDRDLFINNSAVDGGAIADTSTVSLSITNSLFLANTATQGKSVWLDGNETTVNGANPQTDPSEVLTNLVNSNLGLLSNDIAIA